jgi:uncharacterized membrane protein
VLNQTASLLLTPDFQARKMILYIPHHTDAFAQVIKSKDSQNITLRFSKAHSTSTS